MKLTLQKRNRMNKIITLSFFLAIGFISCKTAEKEIQKLEIAENYYKFLDSSDHSGMLTLLSDSIVIRESQDDYEEKFSQQGYIEWVKWDSVFSPTYKVLEIEQENGIVKSKISKIDKRILFLHEEPMVWNEIIRIENSKIVKVERISYDVFNVEIFLKNRAGFLKWIDESQPDLTGVINDQTKTGGIMYLHAIELYQNKY